MHPDHANTECNTRRSTITIIKDNTSNSVHLEPALKPAKQKEYQSIPGPVWKMPVSAPPTRSTFYLIFLKGQPKALGISQLSVAYVQVVFGFVLEYTDGVYATSVSSNIAIPFWAAVAYILSGSLSIAAENTEMRCLVKSSLAFNIISAVISSVEFVILIVDVVINGNYICDQTCITIWTVREIALISLIIATTLQLCVSISISSFGCSSLLGYEIPQQVFVIGNGDPSRNIQPTAPNHGMPTSAPVHQTHTPQYPYVPSGYTNQMNPSIPMNNVNMNFK